MILYSIFEFNSYYGKMARHLETAIIQLFQTRANFWPAAKRTCVDYTKEATLLV